MPRRLADVLLNQISSAQRTRARLCRASTLLAPEFCGPCLSQLHGWRTKQIECHWPTTHHLGEIERNPNPASGPLANKTGTCLKWGTVPWAFEKNRGWILKVNATDPHESCRLGEGGSLAGSAPARTSARWR
jgi:hypothetical protein